MKIADVARLANVSTATVSRALSGSPLVRPETVKRIREIAEGHNYIPNNHARALRVGRSRLFGLVVSDIRNPFFPELIDRFEACATAEQIDVIFTHTNYDARRYEQCVRRMVERNVDGIAMMTSEVVIDALQFVRRARIPFILLNQPPLKAEFPTILVNYAPGFRQAVERLKSLGHRKIGFLGGPGELASARRRLAAFKGALESSKLKLDPHWVLSGDFHIEGGYRSMTELLNLRRRPTALIVANDLMAVGAIQAASAMNVHVPGDISLIGFDNLDICSMLNPPLSSIDVPRNEIAAEAFRYLHDHTRTSSTDTPRPIPTVQTRFIERPSIAPPKEPNSTS